jgi:intraflagellar transport protein 81
MRFADASKRLADSRSSGAQSLSAEQLLANLQKEVKDLVGRREAVESAIFERQAHLDRLQSWENADRVTTEDDVLIKREQVQECEDQLKSLQERLDGALERNNKLEMFRQASSVAQKKLREREEDVERLSEEKRRLRKAVDDKEEELRSAGKGGGKLGRKDLKKYSALVRDKIEVYKTMRAEITRLQAELVVIQRTEQILRSRHKNLDDFIAESERAKGVEGYRETQRSIADMSERTAQVDQMKGMTLEQISGVVDQIGREFRSKQSQLQPLIGELKAVRQDFINTEAEYNESRSTYDRVAVGLELEKQTLEKECDSLQVQ